MVASEFSFSWSGSVDNIAFILAELWALHRSFKPPTSSFFGGHCRPYWWLMSWLVGGVRAAGRHSQTQCQINLKLRWAMDRLTIHLRFWELCISEILRSAQRPSLLLRTASPPSGQGWWLQPGIPTSLETCSEDTRDLERLYRASSGSSTLRLPRNDE